MTIEPAAGIARQQLEQIHPSSNGFRNHFPVATFASRGGVEQPLERASDHTDTTQFDRLAHIGGGLKSTGNSSVHGEEIDAVDARLECQLSPVFPEPSRAADRG